MAGGGGGARGRWTLQTQARRPCPAPQLFEFDGTNASDTAAQPPGRPYPPYSLAEFSWSNVSGSVDPATLSATFQGHPTGDPTGAFANGSLAFRVRAWGVRGWCARVGGGGGAASRRKRPSASATPRLFRPRCRPSLGPAGRPSPLASCTRRTPASWRWP